MSILDAARTAAKQAGSAARAAGDTANTIMEINKRKKEISEKEKMIKSKLAKIGEYYYQKSKEGEIALPDEIIGVSSEIDACKSAIEELNKEIDEIS